MPSDVVVLAVGRRSTGERGERMRGSPSSQRSVSRTASVSIDLPAVERPATERTSFAPTSAVTAPPGLRQATVRHYRDVVGQNSRDHLPRTRETDQSKTRSGHQGRTAADATSRRSRFVVRRVSHNLWLDGARSDVACAEHRVG
ncbi:unnamed protein product [Ixodes pacificus]